MDWEKLDDEFCDAIKAKDIATLEKMIADGFPVNGIEEYGIPLNWVMICDFNGEYIPIAAFLISKGADINFSTSADYFKTPLHMLLAEVHEHFLHSIDGLVKPPKIPLKEPYTPMIDYVLSLNPDLTILDERGWTPLDLAVRRLMKKAAKKIYQQGGILKKFENTEYHEWLLEI